MSDTTSADVKLQTPHKPGEMPQGMHIMHQGRLLYEEMSVYTRLSP